MRRIDPWGLLLAALSIPVFVLHGYQGILTRDLALYAYGGQQFAEGVPPFVAVLNRAGPLAHMVPGVGAMIAGLIGTDDLMTMRVLMTVLSVVAVWVVYLLGRDTFRSRLAGVAAAASLLAFQGFVIYATGGPREKTTMMLLFACSLLAVVHRRWLLAGGAVALATLTWQPVFVAGLSAAVFAILALPDRRARWVGLLRFAGGGVIVTACFVVYYLLEQAFEIFLDAFVIINAEYTRQSGLVQYLVGEPSEIFEGFGWSLFLVLAGLACMIGLGWTGRRRRDRGADDPRTAAVVAMGGATVVSLVWSIAVFNGWADAVFLLPLSATGLGGTVLAVSRRLTGRAGRAAVAAYVVVVLVAAAVNSWHTRDDRLVEMRAANEGVLAELGPDATALSIGSPQPLVFGELRNPIRHQMFIVGLQEYVDDNWPGGLAGLAEDIEDLRPTIITMDEPGWYPFMRPVIRDHYVKIGTTQEIETWYVDRSVGPAEIDRLREIVGG